MDKELEDYLKKRKEFEEKDPFHILSKENKAKEDKLDWLMLKYGSWIRIGNNRVYLKITDGNSFFNRSPFTGELPENFVPQPYFQFLCIFEPDMIADILLFIESSNFKEEDFTAKMKQLEFNGELINCDLNSIVKDIKEFRNSAIYALAGVFADFRNTPNSGIYDRYMKLIKEKPNTETGKEVLVIK